MELRARCRGCGLSFTAASLDVVSARLIAHRRVCDQASFARA